MRTFELQIAPLRCGSGTAAITNLRLVNFGYDNTYFNEKMKNRPLLWQGIFQFTAKILK
ncbi:MAG: hypothetical protein RR728_04940 [Oscillospiraceae bacterium]